MITLLSKIFIKDGGDVSSARVRGAYGTLCGIMGIILNVLLFGIKMLAGAISGSISIMADAFNNLSDAGSSIVTLIGFKLAEKPADEDHPYGHARYEYLSGLAVAAMILIIGFELAKSSVEKIIHPEVPDYSTVSLVIVAVAVAVAGIGVEGCGETARDGVGDVTGAAAAAHGLGANGLQHTSAQNDGIHDLHHGGGNAALLVAGLGLGAEGRTVGKLNSTFGTKHK